MQVQFNCPTGPLCFKHAVQNAIEALRAEEKACICGGADGAEAWKWCMCSCRDKYNVVNPYPELVDEDSLSCYVCEGEGE